MIRTYRFWLSAAFAWALLAGLCLVEVWPNWPESSRQWALLVVAGPPLYIFLEWFVQKMLAPTNERVQNHSAVLLRRILVLLLRVAVLVAVVWGGITIVRL